MSDTKPYAVNHWGSKPGTDDDCWRGADYATLEEALADYNGPAPADTAWIEIDGPGIHAERENPAFKPSQDTDDDWRREMQREAGMLHGVAGWNEFEGC